MRHRLLATAALTTAGVVALAGPASAHDCIRVSAGLRGMVQSAEHSGKWAFVDLNTDLVGFIGPEAAACVLSRYSGPMQFTIGNGVANDGVLAPKAPAKVLSDGRGIDHIDDLLGPALAACGVE